MSNLITIPLIGYAPDLDPATPGVFSYCQGVESTSRGWKIIRNTTGIATSASLNAGSYILDGFVASIVDGTEVRYVTAMDASATKYKAYLDVSGTLTDKSVSGAYTVAGTETFSFCQYGNLTVMTNLVDAVQYRDASTSNLFAATGATNIPKAKICVTWGNPSAPRVMLLDYNDGTHYPDGWWTSANGGPLASWGPVVADGSANGRLLGAGPIRCGIAYGDDIIAWGDRSMWRGTADATLVVAWTRITDEMGCCGPWAAKVINGVLYFVGDQGLFTYDGTFPRKAVFPIQSEIIATVAGLGTSKRLVGVVADGSGQRLQVVLRANGYVPTTAPSKWYLINLLAGGRTSLRGAPSVNAFQLAMDRKYMATCAATAGASGAIALNQEDTRPYGAALTDLFGFGLNFIGDNHEDTRIGGVIPRFITAPSSYSCTDYYGPTMVTALSNTLAAVTVSATPWRADFQQSARWHAPRLYFTTSGLGGATDFECVDVAIIAKPAGKS